MKEGQEEHDSQKEFTDKPLTELETELEFNRLPRSIWEHLFRLGVGVIFGGGLGLVVFSYWISKTTEKGGPLASLATILQIIWAIIGCYVLHYAVIRFVESETVKTLWWGLWLLIGALFVVGMLLS